MFKMGSFHALFLGDIYIICHKKTFLVAQNIHFHKITERFSCVVAHIDDIF